MKTNLSKSLVWVAVILAVGVIVSVGILVNGYKTKYNVAQTISVTGSAQTNFESDIIKWTAQYARKSLDIAEASSWLGHDREAVKTFLNQQGIPSEDIVFQAVNISRDYEYEYDNRGGSTRVFTGYSLYQSVIIESKELDVVEQAAREISSLLSQGIELTSNRPQFYYSDLESLKLDLIKEASKNALHRATNIASESKAEVKGMQQADLGIFQITGQYEDEEYSYGGVFNTHSRNKTAHITIRAKYQLK
ncbi:MAG TPA: SIMPL domain-containing protein [Flavobacteriaceae bacterium]|nr:SIMPL domain-containing protein [Flavobacteriaceae bacterium]